MAKNGKKKSGNREIKQVYLSEDGNKETTVTTAVIEKSKDEEDPEAHKKNESEHRAEHRKHDEADESGKDHSGTHTVRVIAIAVAMFFSLLLSMAVGVGLALWDSNRTIGELNSILFSRNVASAIVPADLPADGETAQEDPDALDEVPEDGPEQENAADEEPADYGTTISDADGLSGVSKADADDEIVAPDDSQVPEVLDPLADYPLDFTTVDESYFTDALFIGDSRLQGFGFWSGLPATYYCATGFQLYKYDTTNVVQTENGKVPIFSAMPYDAFTKIYIKVGLNELGYGTEENFENKYAELIAKLREFEPRAVIYVHGILPVTAAKSQTDKAHNNPNILVRNASLEKFAKDQKAYYLDAGPVLSDEEGNLKPEMTSDGIHLKPEYMKIWRQYLCEHAVVIQ
ncbi:MAG: hypothetical protein K6F87_04395 [Lachnospiraceae bacterium]|nr:hypothetical protein [Lachnospiraceae bacterium]